MLSISMNLGAFQGTQISGVINKYSHVESGAAAGTDFLYLGSAAEIAKFNPGDTVLLIQMKGVQILVPDNSSYGTAQSVAGSPGMHEFMIINDLDNITFRVTFTRNILNNYNVKSNVQLIKIPSYFNAEVKPAGLTCEPWDSVSKTGGVIALVVSRTLTLNGNINAAASGFRGGKIAATTGPGDCVSADPLNLDKYFYDETYANSGYKGESFVSRSHASLIPIFPAFAKGKGVNFNGGGGATGRYAGGGGGAHWGTGGVGGRERPDCFTPAIGGGLGGNKVEFIPTLENKLFMGGGGGSSIYGSGGVATPGGSGGGIVLILCNDIAGNGKIISADGQSATAASGDAGAGGGGAGGTIALYVQGTATSLTLSARGGNGGGNAGTFGEGGGGGGGFIWINGSATLTSVTTTLTGGAKGVRPNPQTSGGNGTVGKYLNTFSPVLNGFLFNTIRSSVTNSLTDSICSNVIPFPMLGSVPVGGQIPYTYRWEIKDDEGGAWTPVGTSTQHYTFDAKQADTFFIRRVVTDNIGLVDISKDVRMIVQPKIENNNVKIYSHITSLTDTLCFGDDPAIINQVNPMLKVPTTKYLYYTWQDSTSSQTWTVRQQGPVESFNPAAGIQTDTWYWRIVTSGRCADTSARVKIRVLPKISNNVVSENDTICHGGAFADITGTLPLAGGDNVYRYRWQSSSSGNPGTWATASGVSNGPAYNPDEAISAFPGKLYFRRKVFSAAHNVCADSSSSSVSVRVDWPVITSNAIAADETICSGSTPLNVTGAEPLNGAGPGTFLYTWQDSTKTHTWQDIPGMIKVTSAGYLPGPLTDTTRYRRIAYSSKCISISNPVIKRVHKPITNYNIRLFSNSWDSVLCNGSSPARFDGLTPGVTSGTGNPANTTFQWSFSNSESGPYSDIPGATGENYKPGALSNLSATVPLDFVYRRKVTNGVCSKFSDSLITIRVLPSISNNVISSSQAVCYNNVPASLTGPGLTGGTGTSPVWTWQQSTNGGTTWSAAVNTSNAQNYQPPALTLPTSYRRLIFSGFKDCCKDTSNILTISINPLPAGTITAATDTICEGVTGQSFRLQISGSTASPWNVVYRENSVSYPAVQITSSVSNIAVTPVIPSPSTASASFRYNLVSITDSYGCVATSLSGERELYVYKVPVVGAGPDASICGPSYTLTATSNVGSGQWTYPGVPVVASTSRFLPAFRVTVDSTLAQLSNKYTFIWTVSNWKCTTSDNADITFYKRPVTANAGADDTLFTLDRIIILPRQDFYPGMTGKWTNLSGVSSSPASDNTDPYEFRIDDNGKVVFEWRITNTINECFSADEVEYLIQGLIIPNAFSPNEDGINDVFEIKGLDLDNTEITLVILNSAGSEVYRSSNINEEYVPWDGTRKGEPVSDGTYYYVVDMKARRTDDFDRTTGFVVVKRDKR